METLLSLIGFGVCGFLVFWGISLIIKADNINAEKETKKRKRR